MIHMLCRVRVQDFDRWMEVFQSHREAHLAAGLTLLRVSRERGDGSHVFFSFDVADMDRARGFIEAPEAAEAGQDSGVIEGEYHFVDVTEGYGVD